MSIVGEEFINGLKANTEKIVRNSIFNVPCTCQFCGNLLENISQLADHESKCCKNNPPIQKEFKNFNYDDFKPFTCNICGLSYTSSSGLHYHKLTHANDNTFNCGYCEKSYLSKRSLVRHEKEHTAERPCQEIDYLKNPLPEQKEDKESNYDILKPFVCNDCGLSYASSAGLRYHKLIHSNDNSYSCAYCDKKYLSKRSLIRHEKEHTVKRPYQCEVCNKTFTRQLSLVQHNLVHTGEKPYKCEVCNKLFTWRSCLNAHSSLHTGYKPFKCEICGSCFVSNSYLQKHRLRTKACRYSQNANDEVVPKPKRKLNQNPYEAKCNVKEKNDDKISEVDIVDVSIIQDINQFELADQEQNYNIDISSKPKLVRSNDGSMKMYCYLCQKWFAYFGIFTWNSHKKMHDIVRKRFRSFQNREQLKDSDLICEKCGKQFKTLTGYTMHNWKRICKTDRSYICVVCEKTFVSNSHLLKHLSSHPEFKLYICENCDTKFSCLEEFNNHRQNKPTSCGLPQFSNARIFPDDLETKTENNSSDELIENDEDDIDSKEDEEEIIEDIRPSFVGYEKEDNNPINLKKADTKPIFVSYEIDSENPISKDSIPIPKDITIKCEDVEFGEEIIFKAVVKDVKEQENNEEMTVSSYKYSSVF